MAQNRRQNDSDPGLLLGWRLSFTLKFLIQIEFRVSPPFRVCHLQFFYLFLCVCVFLIRGEEGGRLGVKFKDIHLR